MKKHNTVAPGFEQPEGAATAAQHPKSALNPTANANDTAPTSAPYDADTPAPSEIFESWPANVQRILEIGERDPDAVSKERLDPSAGDVTPEIEQLAGTHGDCAAQVFRAQRATDRNGQPSVCILEMWAKESGEAKQFHTAIELAALLQVRPYKPSRDPYKEAVKLAREIRREANKRHEKAEFEFSTDSDLDGCLADIEWLWRGYIPKGFLTLIAAEQDHGKSTVVQALLRALIQNTTWPDGQAVPQIAPDQRFLWIDTEGGQALFRQRLIDWKMPRGRFILPKDPLKEIMLDNPADWKWIEAMIDQFTPPVIVIDSFSGGHTGDENSNSSMKPLAKKLAELAQRRGIATIAIHHLNKAPAGVPDYPITLARLRGATTITQFSRSVLALGVPDKGQPENRRLDVIKLNIAKKPAPVGYILTDDGPAWGKAPEVPKPHRAIDDAIDFLSVALDNRLRPSDEIAAEAKAKGIGSNALNDAKKVLGIKPVREGGREGRWFLEMPKQPDE